MQMAGENAYLVNDLIPNRIAAKGKSRNAGQQAQTVCLLINDVKKSHRWVGSRSKFTPKNRFARAKYSQNYRTNHVDQSVRRRRAGPSLSTRDVGPEDGCIPRNFVYTCLELVGRNSKNYSYGMALWQETFFHPGPEVQ